MCSEVHESDRNRKCCRNSKYSEETGRWLSRGLCLAEGENEWNGLMKRRKWSGKQKRHLLGETE